jgi:hypothetical protein
VDRQAFEVTKDEIMRTFAPSAGSSLDGFLMDVDFYLNQSEAWSRPKVKKTRDPGCLLSATASAALSLSPANATAELQRIWCEYLAYDERGAHMFSVETSAVTLDYVTAARSLGYVTGRIVIRLPARP